MDIAQQLDQMLTSHKEALKKKPSERKITCGIKSCGKELTNLVYKIDKLKRKHLCGLCEHHGFTFHPLIEGLKIPKTRGRLKSKRKKGKRIVRNQEALF